MFLQEATKVQEEQLRVGAEAIQLRIKVTRFLLLYS